MKTVVENREMEWLFKSTKAELECKIRFLPDKPEETIDSTLRACWLTASGSPKSSEEAVKHALPRLTRKQIRLFRQLIDKRLNNMPLAHITGRQSFIGIELLSDERALIPRKETEILGRKALELSHELADEKRKINVMDICCGAGNLGLVLAHLNHKSMVYATDLSHAAVALTKDNINFLNLHHRVLAEQGNLFSAFEKEYHYSNTDLIICNPPYISSLKVSKMHTEISDHEPVLAFDGGIFGTDIIEKFLCEAPKYLVAGGWIIFEVGVGQGDFMLLLCKRSNMYRDISSVTDESGNIRVILARK